MGGTKTRPKGLPLVNLYLCTSYSKHMKKPISGFSKLSKAEKMAWLSQEYTEDPQGTIELLQSYWHPDPATQQLHEEFIENTLSNYFLPFAIAPNFEINGQLYAVPMAIEESSVVAAASKAAKYWGERGGFKATVLKTEKVGQVHFVCAAPEGVVQQFFEEVKSQILADTDELTEKMRSRGGGILDLQLRDKTASIEHYYQLHAAFETKDAMGANFINTCLEQMAKSLEILAAEHPSMQAYPVEVVMSILSNYVPDCLVRAEVSCPVSQMAEAGMDGEGFATKFVQAVEIAREEPYRAVTHNKGIMNGIDAVVLATGNDFRAIEAGVHAYAARDGQYRSLSEAEIKEIDGELCFRFWMDLPLALGTVGGLTRLHPMVKLALDVLGKPNAQELMGITAVAGLAQNFAALRSLTTTGIQKGHMKMHLLNILNQLGASSDEKEALVDYFKDHTVSNAAVEKALTEHRNK